MTCFTRTKGGRTKTLASRRRTYGVIAVILAAVLLSAEVWSVVPAPTLPLLVLAVAIPELAPWALAICGTVALFAWSLARGRPRTVALGLCAAAFACASVPLVQLPATIGAADAQMARVLPPVAAPAPAGHPFDPVISFTGYGGLPPVSVRHDLPVALRDGTRLALDLYRPQGNGPHATLVVLYGGAWRFGNRRTTARLDRAFAARGYTVIALEYRHVPAHRFPTQLDDVRDALRAIARNARAWNVDPHRVALFGQSAGAELALLAAYAPRQPFDVRVRAAIGYYTPADLVRGYAEPPQPDPANVRDILQAYIGGTPAQRLPAYLAASPLAHVRPGLPATLLISGGRDELVALAFQHELRDALQASGVPVVAIDVPWSNHAFDAVDNGVGGQLARYYTERFLAAYL